MGNALAVLADHDLTSGNLYVDVDGQAKPVTELHPDDKAYARLDPKVVLQQHPGAYFRLRVAPQDTWKSPFGAQVVRQSLESFLASRVPGFAAPDRNSDSGRLSTWGWVAAIGSALNAVGLLFYPLGDSTTIATLRTYGGRPTPLVLLLSRWWFSPLLAVLTAACLVQAYRSPVRRRLWITVSYLPATLGLLAAMLGALSTFSGMFDNVK